MKLKRMQALGLEAWVQILTLLLTSWETLGKSTSEPQFPHL